MSVLQRSAGMWLCVYLLCSGLQLTAGCSEEKSYIRCSPGESVLLNCCQERSQTTDIHWGYSADLSAIKPEYSVYPVNSDKAQRYRNRVKIYDNHSLSITELTVENEGLYWCKACEGEYIHLSVTGCSLENSTTEKIITYSGESVLLPCAVKCSAWKTPDKSLWKLPNHEINTNISSAELNQLYHGRVQMFNVNSGNLSLLISDLTDEDVGLYSCWIHENQHKNFSVTFKGCTLKQSEGKSEMKYPGEDVHLSCSCADPKTRPEKFRWVYLDSNRTEVSIETSRYSGRVHMFNRTTPSNLSLVISNLTEEDQGIYRCIINNNQSTDTNLTVKGCVLSEPDINIYIHTGESVLLTCSCEDDQTKPKHFEWKRDFNTIVSDTEDSKGRFQMFVRNSPANLSLLISNLTASDQGLYVCTVNGKQSRSVNLIIPGDFSFTLSVSMFLICLIVLGGAVCVCCTRTRGNKERRGSPDHKDNMTYITVVYKLVEN